MGRKNNLKGKKGERKIRIKNRKRKIGKKRRKIMKRKEKRMKRKRGEKNSNKREKKKIRKKEEKENNEKKNKNEVEFVSSKFSAFWDLPLGAAFMLTEAVLYTAFRPSRMCPKLSTFGSRQHVQSFKRSTVCGCLLWPWLCTGGTRAGFLAAWGLRAGQQTSQCTSGLASGCFPAVKFSHLRGCF